MYACTDLPGTHARASITGGDGGGAAKMASALVATGGGCRPARALTMFCLL